MKHVILSCLAALLLGTSAQAACYADYKAKRDKPLRLHYGVAAIDAPCNKNAATRQLEARLGQQGWTLLTVMSVFDDAGLEERKDSAGEFFLRF